MGLTRLSLYLLGIATGVAAIILYGNRPKALKAGSGNRLPVEDAAAKLRTAWASRNTTA